MYLYFLAVSHCLADPLKKILVAVKGFSILFGSLKLPVSSIFSMPSLGKLALPRRGRESIFSFRTTGGAQISLVWFSISTVHSPLIGRSWLSAFKLRFDSCSVVSGLCRCNLLNWYSSMMFVSSPVSGSIVVLMPFRRIVLGFCIPWTALWILRWWTK